MNSDEILGLIFYTIVIFFNLKMFRRVIDKRKEGKGTESALPYAPFITYNFILYIGCWILLSAFYHIFRFILNILFGIDLPNFINPS